MTSRRIQQLSLVLANQIAAGEVIERPASVVKELLENALDAGATQLSIEIGFGGLNHILVSDNGQGIHADDLPLAIAAHATSKIRALEDLYAITSMGFRGEALASIAAISKLTLTSRDRDAPQATQLYVEGDSSPTYSSAARSPGTTVEISDLFFNAPVRKRFLKSADQEYQAIERVVKRFALSAPTLAMVLSHNGKVRLTLPAAGCDATRFLRIKKIVGKDFVENALFLDVAHASMRLTGWVSGLGFQSSQNDKQWVYLNQRMVKDKLIHHALKQAYEGLLHPGRYPACVLDLSVPVDTIDVNVHPTKHEVRFEEARLVHDFIKQQISRLLAERIEAHSVPLAIREDYSHLQGVAYPRIMVLNEQFVLAFLNERPCLIDLALAAATRLRKQLEEASFPLASRPLLVPLRYEWSRDDAKQSTLSSLGVQLERVSAFECVVRTMPIVCPQLDLAAFLDEFNNTATFLLQEGGKGRDKWITLVVKHTVFDARQLSKEELEEWVEAWHRQVPDKIYCLDSATCRTLIHG